SILLTGGNVAVTGDYDILQLVAPTSSTGQINIETTTPFTAGGANLIDFSSLQPGAALRLGGNTGTSTATIAASTLLLPDAISLLRLGGAGRLTVFGSITDVGGAPTTLDLAGGSVTLAALSSYTGATFVRAANVLNV